jgi:Cyclic nucleotide-binding domain
MQKRSKQPRPRERGALFGESIIDPLGHLSARYPFPARLNEHYVAKLKALNVGTSFSKGSVLFEEGDRPTGVYVVLEGCVKLSINSAQGKTLFAWFLWSGHDPRTRRCDLGTYACGHCGNPEAERSFWCLAKNSSEKCRATRRSLAKWRNW